MLSKPADQCPSAAEFRKVCRFSGDASVRQALDERLLQIAFTDRVIVVGYDRQSETPIERVSSAECLKAIEILKKYDMGPPPKVDSRLEWAEHVRQVERDRVATVIQLLGHKLRDKTPEQIAAYFDACANEPGKFVDIANKLMDGQEQLDEPDGRAQLPETEPKP